jgi:hypothetical protein
VRLRPSESWPATRPPDSGDRHFMIGPQLDLFADALQGRDG